MKSKALITRYLKFILYMIVVNLSFATLALAQSGLEGKINETILDLVRIINILIVGFVAWSGFLISKGDSSGVTRLIYGVVGLIVVNASYLIINYFK
ncbi:MAG: hypothetical protein KDD58_06395 [Bdellovibrionales bacterium]|nr:hypothetical protein [Bdellovibrionales bacterium]